MTRTLLFPALILIAITGCQREGPDRPWLGAVTPVDAPSAMGGRYPNLAVGVGGTPVLMSWLQPGPADQYSLQYAAWSDRGWEAARTVASGTGWFVNWADFPSVVPVSERTWAAHWLEQRPGDVYAYDVRIAVSDDAGGRWSAPMSPHDDGTPTEHGFVTLLPGSGAAVRAVWLDGRMTSGEHTGESHDAGGGGAMTLRVADIDGAGRRIDLDRELDARVCDCCQTDAAVAADGAVVVYRDRAEDELRNIRALRLDRSNAAEPVRVHDDGWRIGGCPVNGPAVAARGDRVAVAWFTAPDTARVRLAFSTDGGRSFAPPIEVAAGKVAGRVDVVLLEDGRAVVSWLAEVASGAELRAQPFRADGASGPAVVIARPGLSRSSGFPQMVVAGQELLFAWTEAGEPTRLRTARARLL